MIRYQALKQLFLLSLNKKVLPQVKGICREAIDTMARELKGDKSPFSEELLMEIEKFEDDPEEFQVPNISKIPDGSPIGSFQCSYGFEN